MKNSLALVALATVSLVKSQAVGLCKAEGCDDCPSSITTAGTGYPECVIYDTETVLGGLGYEAGAGGDLLYKVFGNFPDPGPSCNTMIRSPASLTEIGCGNLIYQTNDAECSSGLQLQDTFLVQFCCGEGDCGAAGVPFKRSVAGHTDRRQASSVHGTFLKLANGTIIEPLAVGHAPEAADAKVRRDDCDGYVAGSYVANGEPILKTFATQIVSSTVGPFSEDTTITNTYDQTVERSTTFDTTIGDPFGIVSVSVGFEFSTSMTTGLQYNVPVSAGTSGQIGFTPVYRCTTGTIQTCTAGAADGESCTPYVLSGVVQGDYLLVQS